MVRAKSNLAYCRRAYHPVDKSTGLRSDQRILLQGPKTAQAYPDTLRRISYVDTDTQKRLVFLTNNFTLPALTIAHLYKCRWRVELFFKWIKQYLRIKAFFGTSQNAVKTQIWIAISVYLLVAILQEGTENRPKSWRNLANSQHHPHRKSLYESSTEEIPFATKRFPIL